MKTLIKLTFIILLVNLIQPILSNQHMNETKKIVMIIAHEGFRDEELFEPKEIFENNGYKVTVASTDLSDATGKLGEKAKVHMLVKNINVDDFDAIVFVGGPGASKYFDDPVAIQLAKDAYKQDKVVAAICIAPNILANAGLLKGIKATCWDSSNLKKKGADYTGNPVERSGRIITGKNPGAAHKFAETILSALKEK